MTFKECLRKVNWRFMLELNDTTYDVQACLENPKSADFLKKPAEIRVVAQSPIINCAGRTFLEYPAVKGGKNDEILFHNTTTIEYR